MNVPASFFWLNFLSKKAKDKLIFGALVLAFLCPKVGTWMWHEWTAYETNRIQTRSQAMLKAQQATVDKLMRSLPSARPAPPAPVRDTRFPEPITLQYPDKK